MCMFMPRLLSLTAVVPLAILLTISFFVLFAVRKVEEKGLKIFGYVVASLLWLAALVVFSGAIYNMQGSAVAMKPMAQQKMKTSCLGQAARKDKMPGMLLPDKGMPVKDEKIPKISSYQGNKGIIYKAEEDIRL